jgi:hypothetical protein
MLNREKEMAVRALADRRGRIIPRRLVEAARDPSHPLHDQFPWDDSVAAERYRLDIATKIIREIRIVTEVDDRKVRTIAFVRDPSLPPNVSGYVALSTITRRSNEAILIVSGEIARAIAAISRAREIADSVGLRNELEEELRRLIVLQQKTERGGAPKQMKKKRGRPRGDEARP